MRYIQILLVLFAAGFLCLGTGILLYNVPPIYERIAWYADTIPVTLYRAIHPPEEVLFVSQDLIEAAAQATLHARIPPAATAANPPTAQPPPSRTPGSFETPLPAAPLPTAAPTSPLTPAPTDAPLPAYVSLDGVRSEIETRNNCGPATLAMALSYWGWQGDQAVVRAVLRPNLKVDDKNVMPEEMANYARTEAGLRGLVRMGGDLELLKRLIAAGFPVIVEKGHITTGWIGHYVLLTGYDDSEGVFLSQDSLIKTRDTPVPYPDLIDHWWRHFNYLYLVIFPPDREAEVMAALGSHADPTANFQAAADRARQESSRLEGRELFFAWHNLGTSLAGLGEYAAAAQAYDTAYAGVYPTLEKAERPWRALWYQDGPYRAYYFSGRYPDVIRMADATLTAAGAPILEESFYWRGKARQALGDEEGAIADYQTAAKLNPYSTPALEELQRLGEEIP